MNRIIFILSFLFFVTTIHAQSLDSQFQPTEIKHPETEEIGEVLQIAFQSDGKVIVSGIFSINRNLQPFCYRLNLNGAIDESFAIDSSIKNLLLSRILVQSDNKLLITANSLEPAQQTYATHRLLDNGQIDTTFEQNKPKKLKTAGFHTAKQLPNGQLLLTTEKLIILDTDGTPISNNLSLLEEQYITDIEIQSDGKILLAGSSENTGLLGTTALIRLNTDFTIDPTFQLVALTNPISLGSIQDVAILANGTIAIGGQFTHLNGSPVPNIFLFLTANGTLKTTPTLRTGYEELDAQDVPNTFVKQVILISDDLLLVNGGYGFFYFHRK